MIELSTGQLQRRYLNQLGTLDKVTHDFPKQAGRLEWAVEELLSIIDMHRPRLTVDQERVVRRARELTP